MKALLVVATFFTVLAQISATPTRTSSIADLVHQLSLSSAKNTALEETFGDDENEDEMVGNVMATALLQSMLDGDEDEDGGNSMMAIMMMENEENAVAQFRLFKKFWNKMKKSHFGKHAGDYLRKRYCGSQ